MVFKLRAVKLIALLASLCAFTTIGHAQTVCIDPGHPSETSAGANAHGLSENTLNWQVAQEIKPLLEARGFKVVMTKNSLKQRVTNKQRAEIANKAGAKLFIRLHCDVGGGSGFAWYYPDRAGRKGNRIGPNTYVIKESRIAATTINEAMKPILKPWLRSNPVKTDASTFVGGKQGGVLTGSIYSDVPTALIHMCFINKKNDAAFIASPNGRKWMAKAIATGVEAYLRR